MRRPASGPPFLPHTKWSCNFSRRERCVRCPVRQPPGALEVVRARLCIGPLSGNRGASDLVRYLLNPGHALRTLMLTPPPCDFDSRDKALTAFLHHLEKCCCRATQVQPPIEPTLERSISVGFQWIPSFRSSRHAHRNRSFSRDPSQEMPGRGC